MAFEVLVSFWGPVPLIALIDSPSRQTLTVLKPDLLPIVVFCSGRDTRQGFWRNRASLDLSYFDNGIAVGSKGSSC